jgi:hypothetical protein
MRRIVLTFGLISGLILVAMLAVLMPLSMSGRIDFDLGQVIGYSSMVMAFILVFFGIRSYRENVGGGVISFGRAFAVGILITLVASTVYVVCWEIYYYTFDPQFEQKYAAFVIEKARASGASEAAIEAERVRMQQFTELYKNPLINIGITFMEVFPIGLIVTLVSAGILRRQGLGER